MKVEISLVSTSPLPSAPMGLSFKAMNRAIGVSLMLAITFAGPRCSAQKNESKGNVSAKTEVPSSAHTNRLSREKSPYLLQHQYNPVDWYAWSEEAFAKAREENKPIFLSIGYST